MGLNGSGDHERWRLTKEKILFGFGIGLISFEAFALTLGFPFRFELVLAGLACLGVSITQLGDKRSAGGDK